MQYHPIFIAMVEKVRGGLIGDLRYVYSNRMSLGKFRIEENVLWSFAPHDISMLLKLADSNVTHVEAQGAAFVTPGIADWCTAQLAFDKGIKGHIQVSWLHPFKEQRLVAIGSKGMLVFEDSLKEWDKKLAFYPHGISTDGPAPVPQSAPVEYLSVPVGEPLKAECQHFITSVEQGTRPVTDGAEGRAVLDVLSQAEARLSAYLSEH
jgi:predicted dehydrogenase